MDVAQVQNFTRRVLDFRIEELPGCSWGGRALLQLHIRGTAFLWHQVRAALRAGPRVWQVGVVAAHLHAAAPASSAGKSAC